MGMPLSALVEAGNYLTQRLRAHPIEAREHILSELEASRAGTRPAHRQAGGAGARNLGGSSRRRRHRQGPVTAARGCDRPQRPRAGARAADRARHPRVHGKALDVTQGPDGVQIYIGAENELFSLAGCSVVFAPYRDGREQIIGAIGVVGPTPDELCADHPHGRLYGPGHRPDHWLTPGVDRAYAATDQRKTPNIARGPGGCHWRSGRARAAKADAAAVRPSWPKCRARPLRRCSRGEWRPKDQLLRALRRRRMSAGAASATARSRSAMPPPAWHAIC